jgi:hypothetical protein
MLICATGKNGQILIKSVNWTSSKKFIISMAQLKSQLGAYSTLVSFKAPMEEQKHRK